MCAYEPPYLPVLACNPIEFVRSVHSLILILKLLRPDLLLIVANSP